MVFASVLSLPAVERRKSRNSVFLHHTIPSPPVITAGLPSCYDTVHRLQAEKVCVVFAEEGDSLRSSWRWRGTAGPPRACTPHPQSFCPLEGERGYDSEP